MRLYLRVFATFAALILVAMIFHARLASRDEQLRLQSVIRTQNQQIDAANAREHDRAVALNQTMAEIEKLKRETQTPQQILENLPKYLPLPQPITMAPSAQPGVVANAEGEEKGTRADPKTATPKVWNSLAGKMESVGREIGSHLPAGSPQVIVGGRKDEAEAVATLSRQDDDDKASMDSSAENDQTRTKSRQGFAGHSSDRASDLPASAQKSSEDQPPCHPAPSTHEACSDRGSANSPSDAQIPAADLKPLYDYVQNCRGFEAQLFAAKQNQIDDEAKLEAVTRERDAAITASKGGTTWRRLGRNAIWFAIGAATATASVTLTAASARHDRSQRR